ncbi:MAG: hypothetical protein CEN90_60 [Parcubacteria group bacterium Licking1014_17]|nr:MAG: hypothetical protein CEN90_60 [Parcubacteria group bacterium Licking1014_17]
MMKRFNKKIIITLVIILGVFMLSLGFVWAIGVGISISPLKYKYSVDPGTVIDDVINVGNPNAGDLRVKVEFQDFMVTEGNNIKWIPNDIENPHKMVDWIDIDTEPFTVAPGKQVAVPFKINVPKNATPGGKYAAIFFSEADKGGGNLLGAIARVGSLIIMNVNGDVKQTGQLVDFTGPTIAWSGPVNFVLSMMNVGTTHFEVKPVVTINNFFWQSAKILPESKFIYPNVKRDIPIKWEKSNPFGLYSAKVSVTDGEGTVFEKTKWFVAIPATYAIIILAVVLVLWFGIRFFKHTFKISKIITRKSRSAA